MFLWRKISKRYVVKSSNLGEKNMWYCALVGAKEDRWKIVYAWPKRFKFIIGNFLKLRTVGDNWTISNVLWKMNHKHHLKIS